MLSRFKSMFAKEKEAEMSLSEYGTTPNEVLANYVEARDYGHSQKAYAYLSTLEKKRMSFSKFLEMLETNPYTADTVAVINHRTKNQKFEVVKRNDTRAIVRWVVDFTGLYTSKKQVAVELDGDDDYYEESNIQTFEFKLIKEGEHWKVLLK